MVEVLVDRLVLQRSPEALFRRLLDGVIVMAPGMSEPVGVTAPGEVLWAMLADPCSVADLVDVWVELYGVPRQTARAEIEPVLRLWLDGAALIRLDDEARPQVGLDVDILRSDGR